MHALHLTDSRHKVTHTNLQHALASARIKSQITSQSARPQQQLGQVPAQQAIRLITSQSVTDTNSNGAIAGTAGNNMLTIDNQSSVPGQQFPARYTTAATAAAETQTTNVLSTPAEGCHNTNSYQPQLQLRVTESIAAVLRVWSGLTSLNMMNVKGTCRHWQGAATVDTVHT